jgi:ribonuclease-3
MLDNMKNLINSLLANINSPSQESTNLTALMKVLRYKFTTDGLLQSAITHTSIEHAVDLTPPFERMEFLGDSVLGLIIAESLFAKFPEYSEGQLSKLKAKVVSRKFLATVAREISLGDFILLSREADKTGGRNNSSILADAMEAIICAVYLDGGIEKARELINRLLFKNYEKVLGIRDMVNYKSKLQEFTQLRNQGLPDYILVSETGPDHDKNFIIEVHIDQVPAGRGSGHTKKEAQQEAAKVACTFLEI